MADFSHLARQTRPENDSPELAMTEPEYEAYVAKRLQAGELSSARAQMLIGRYGARKAAITNWIDAVLHRPYREGRVGPATGFSADEERMLVDATLEFANAKNSPELQNATDRFATWFNARPASRDEVDEELWRLLQPTELCGETNAALMTLSEASETKLEELRSGLIQLPPRLTMTTDFSIGDDGRVQVWYSLMECHLHDILDFALLLLLDPTRDFGRLRRCKYERCNRWFFARRNDNVFCPARTGRKCNRADYDRRTSRDKKRRYRERKRREAEAKQRGSTT